MNGCTSVRRIMVAAFCGLAVLAGPATANEALAERIGCLQCHSVDGKSIGPALRDIAARYKDDNRARETLIQKVKQGGKGNWTKVTGGVPMPAFSSLLADEEIRGLVDWVLSR
jgi:cytochrome c